MGKTVVRYGVVAWALALCMAAQPGLFGPGAVGQEVQRVAQEQPGFKSVSSFAEFSKGESVNDLSGGLTVTHASAVALPERLGWTLRPVRVYNSKTLDDAYDLGWSPNWDPNDKLSGVLGLGWHLGFGRISVRLAQHEVYGSPGTYETRIFYFYEDESGTERRLYRGGAMENWASDATEPADANGAWYYTNDGSYIRARYVAGTSHRWTLYFPDGSVREAQGTANNALDATNVPSFVPYVSGGTGTNRFVKNPHQHGWYVTKITDRAGNQTTLAYNAFNATSQPYGGSLSAITDPFGRTIAFSYDATTHLLSSIAGAGRTENYLVDTATFWTPPGMTDVKQVPALTKVWVTGYPETLYRYETSVRAKAVLEVVAHCNGSRNPPPPDGYFYDVLASPNYTLQTGDRLEYDIYVGGASPGAQSGIDLIANGWTLRDSGATDQYGVSAHPATDISAHALGQWYHRVIPIPASGIGKSLTGTGYGVFLAFEADWAGDYTTYATNIKITNTSGATNLLVYDGETAFTYPDDTGYSFFYNYTMTTETTSTGGVAPGGSGGFPRDFLARIYYPTGALSLYRYGTYSYVKGRFPLNPASADIDLVDSFGVVQHTVVAAAPDGAGAMNQYTWTWNRSYREGPYLATAFTFNGHGDDVVPVLFTDPLGTQEVIYFSADNGATSYFSPGMELLRTRRDPAGAGYNPPTTRTAIALYDAREGAVTWKLQEWGFNDHYAAGVYTGDAHLCQQDGATAAETNLHGNPRPWKTTNTEADPATKDAKWQTATESYTWDGFGHYALDKTTGTPSPGTGRDRFSYRSYDLKTDTASGPYQLDRLTLAYGGEGTMTWVPFHYTLAGTFKAVSSVYETADRGLLSQQTSRVVAMTTLIFDVNNGDITAPTADGGDKVMAVAYDATAGDLTRLAYSRADATGNSYGFNFRWSNGMVNKMWRGPETGGSYTETSPEWTRTIDTYGKITAHTDANGFATSFAYDDLGRLTTITPPTPENPTRVAYVTGTSEDLVRGVTWTTEHVIRFYRGALTSVPALDPSGTPITTEIGTGDTFVHYEFDDQGRLFRTSTVMPNGKWSQAETLYDPFGRAVFSSLPFEFGTRPVGAAIDHPLRADLTAPEDPVQSLSLYPPRMNVTPPGDYPWGSWDTMYSSPTRMAPFGGAVETLYRSLYALKPDGNKTGTAYGGPYDLDRTVTIYGIQGESAPLDSATVYTSNIYGQLTHVDAPVGADADYTYDKLGNLTGVSLVAAGLSNQTRSWSYNALGRLTQAVNPENGTTNYLGYDCIGNLLSAQDANGAAAATPYKAANTYDALGRLATVQKLNASSGALIATILENTYDDATAPNKGKLTRAVAYQEDGSNVRTDYTYTADHGGRPYEVTETASAWGTSAPNYVHRYTYDGYGQATTLALLEGIANRGRILSTFTHGAVTDRGIIADRTLLASLEYTAAGALNVITFDVGDKQQADFDEYLRPRGFGLTNGVTTYWGNGSLAPVGPGGYGYDGAGNIKTITESGNVTDQFYYDALSRLTKANTYKGTGLHTFLYTYDDYGNLTRRVEDYNAASFTDLKDYLTKPPAQGGLGLSGVEGYIGEAVFDATVAATGTVKNNRLNTVTRGGTIGGKATGIAQTNATFSYDGNGNVTADGQYAYKYDAQNRQAAVYLTDGATKVYDHYYDAGGERVASVKYVGGAKTSFTQYVRDGAAVIYERTWNWVSNAWVADKEKTYLYGGGRMAATKETVALSGTPVTTYTYYAVDHLGSVRYSRTYTPTGTLVTNGAVAYKTEPFGVLLPSTDGLASPNGNTHLYTGHERDAMPNGFNQDNMHFRQYGSAMGRFFKPDDQFGSPLNPQGWNLYTYVKGNPVTFNDPTGHVASKPDQQAQQGSKNPAPPPNAGPGAMQEHEDRKKLDEAKKAGSVIVIDKNATKEVTDAKGNKHTVYKATVYKNTTMDEYKQGKTDKKETTEVYVGITAENDKALKAKKDAKEGEHFGTNMDTPPGEYNVTPSTGTEGKPNGWLMFNTPGEKEGVVKVGDLERKGMSIHSGTPANSEGCITSQDFDTLKDAVKPDLDANTPVSIIVPNIYECPLSLVLFMVRAIKATTSDPLPPGCTLAESDGQLEIISGGRKCTGYRFTKAVVTDKSKRLIFNYVLNTLLTYKSLEEAERAIRELLPTATLQKEFLDAVYAVKDSKLWADGNSDVAYYILLDATLNKSLDGYGFALANSSMKHVVDACNTEWLYGRVFFLINFICDVRKEAEPTLEAIAECTFSTRSNYVLALLSAAGLARLGEQQKAESLVTRVECAAKEEKNDPLLKAAQQIRILLGNIPSDPSTFNQQLQRILL